MSAATITYDSPRGPRITLTKSEGGAFIALLEVKGLAPTRTVSADERRIGVLSLSPVTVTAPAGTKAADTHRRLIDVACRALVSSIASTDGVDPRPSELVMIKMRTAFGLRTALRELGEDI